MDERFIMVNMGQIAVSDAPGDILTALGLGSCIAVCVYDPVIRLGGMIHVVLPSSSIGRSSDAPGKFADLGVPKLLEQMKDAGGVRSRFSIAILGGANVLTSANHDGVLDIGQRNIQAVKLALSQQGLSPSADHVGGKSSRTVRLRIANGEVTVKTVREGEAPIAYLRSRCG